ncbi:GntR family transcriptional regulator [Streptomyces sp. NPDC002680]|uniref:GntR family transcriptional regulator n=1 Tax=Streptomyces sp. NPDC002680 TaxID=3364659 RepID=UPI003684B11B
MSLNTVSALDALTDALRSRILNGDFDPDEHLVEKSLADQYAVARHTLRIALQALESEGLLRREPRRGVFVASVEPEDVLDIFRARVALELEAVHVIVSRKLSLDAVREACRHLQAIPRDASWTEVINRDFAFHHALVHAAASPRLARTYASLQAETRLAMVRQKPLYATVTAVADEHGPIFDAVARGAEKEACALLRHHIEHSGQQLAAFIESRRRDDR